MNVFIDSISDVKISYSGYVLSRYIIYLAKYIFVLVMSYIDINTRAYSPQEPQIMLYS